MSADFFSLHAGDQAARRNRPGGRDLIFSAKRCMRWGAMSGGAVAQILQELEEEPTFRWRGRFVSGCEGFRMQALCQRLPRAETGPAFENTSKERNRESDLE